MQPTAIDSIEELDDLLTAPDAGVLETLRQMPGKYAVLGAGGKMGFHVSRMLQRALQELGRSDPVITISRFSDTQKREQFESAGFEVCCADMSDAEQVSQLPLAENVFFLAGVKFGTASNPELLQRMNIDMPRLVAQHYRQSRIVALSTGCVYAFVAPESGGSTEESATDPPGDYAGSCLGREQAFFENSLTQGTATSIIRLNYANECRYGVLVDIAYAVQAGQELSLDTGYVNVIWQGDAVKHTIRSIALADSPPFILNVTGPRVLSVRELAEGFGRRLGKSTKFTGQETNTAWLNNAALSHRLFGPPSVDIEQMMDWIADWIAAERPILNKPTQFQVRDGDY